MPRRTKKRAYDSNATRQRILDAASDAFQRRGYHATSMHDLMEAADVPAGSMYHCFPTKKGLALAVISERVAPAVNETWIAPLLGAEDARTGILSVFQDVAASIERRRGKAIGCPVSNLAVELALVDREFQAALAAVFEQWGSAVRERLSREVRSDSERAQVSALATAIVASFSGAMTLAKTGQSATPIRECARVIEQLLGNTPRSAKRVR